MPPTRGNKVNPKRNCRTPAAKPQPPSGKEHNPWLEPQDFSRWEKPLDQSVWDLKVLEHQAHVDAVYDIVPFWLKGIEAAERGQTLRMMDFLESLDTQAEGRRGEDEEETDNPFLQPARADNWAQWYDSSDEPQGESAARDDWGRPAGYAGQEWEESGDSEEEWRKTLEECERVSPWSKVNVTRDEDEVSKGWIGQGQKKFRRSSRCMDGFHQDPSNLIELIASKQGVDPQRRKNMHRFLELPVEEKLQTIEAIIRDLRSR